MKMINLTDGVTVASIAKVRDKDPEADANSEETARESDDNGEERSADEAVTDSEEE